MTASTKRISGLDISSIIVKGRRIDTMALVPEKIGVRFEVEHVGQQGSAHWKDCPHVWLIARRHELTELLRHAEIRMIARLDLQKMRGESRVISPKEVLLESLFKHVPRWATWSFQAVRVR